MSIKNIIKKENKFEKEYLAIVVSNDDPLKRGRLQVKIDAILGDIPFWVNSTLIAGSTKLLLIPEQDDTVKVRFKNKDIYSGEWSLNSNPNNESNIDPNKYGFSDEHGNRIIIDKANKTLDLTINEGVVNISAINGSNSTSITVNKDGTITLTGTSFIVNAAQTTINGALTATGTCIFEGITWASHNHPYSWTDPAGSGNTGAPQN